jgi:hypothetical protein
LVKVNGDVMPFVARMLGKSKGNLSKPVKMISTHPG